MRRGYGLWQPLPAASPGCRAGGRGQGGHAKAGDGSRRHSQPLGCGAATCEPLQVWSGHLGLRSANSYCGSWSASYLGHNTILQAIRCLKEICPVVSSLHCPLLHPQSSMQEVIYIQCNFEYEVLQLYIYKGEDNIAFIVFMAFENTGQRNYHLPHTVH